MQRVLCATFLILFSCNQVKTSSVGEESIHSKEDTFQLELSDTNLLMREAAGFYRGTKGHLYMRTVGLREDSTGHLQEHEYLNGVLPQEIDPKSFEQLNGWYAKDRHNVYYCRPVSGGLFVQTIHLADYSTFRVLEGHYIFAADKNRFYSILGNDWIEIYRLGRQKSFETRLD